MAQSGRLAAKVAAGVGELLFRLHQSRHDTSNKPIDIFNTEMNLHSLGSSTISNGHLWQLRLVLLHGFSVGSSWLVNFAHPTSIGSLQQRRQSTSHSGLSLL